MGSVSRMASKCRACPDRDKCNHKYMEACAYIDEPQASVQPQISFSASVNVDVSKIINGALKEAIGRGIRCAMNGVR